MERKIGEIFEYDGEWYQCIVGNGCKNCAFYEGKCYSSTDNDDPIGGCSAVKRKDNKEVIFKKLEKVGEQFLYKGIQMQSYIRATDELICNWNNNLLLLEHGDSDIIDIEIKQNKEDMKIDKVVMNIDDRDYLLDRLEAILHDTHCQEYKDEICEALSKYIVTETASSLKPFDLDAAKAGKPVCTRDGRKARIICFDRVGDFPIVALTDDRDYKEEGVNLYDINGKGSNECFDLMMLPEKKEGWVNVYREESNNNERLIEQTIYKTRKDAFDNACPKGYITTTKINWEE